MSEESGARYGKERGREIPFFPLSPASAKNRTFGRRLSLNEQCLNFPDSLLATIAGLNFYSYARSEEERARVWPRYIVFNRLPEVLIRLIVVCFIYFFSFFLFFFWKITERRSKGEGTRTGQGSDGFNPWLHVFSLSCQRMNVFNHVTR